MTLETVTSETPDAVMKVSQVVSDDTVDGSPTAVPRYLDAVIPSGKLNVTCIQIILVPVTLKIKFESKLLKLV